MVFVNSKYNDVNVKLYTDFFFFFIFERQGPLALLVYNISTDVKALFPGIYRINNVVGEHKLIALFFPVGD